MTAFFSAYAVQLAYESWLFGDRADGLLPIPLVLPQSTMALGAIVLVVRFLDEVVTLLQTGAPIHLLSHEEVALRDLVGGETSPRDARGCESPMDPLAWTAPILILVLYAPPLAPGSGSRWRSA
jgi:hypothetical protein